MKFVLTTVLLALSLLLALILHQTLPSTTMTSLFSTNKKATDEPLRNSAFVFIKPHANTPEVRNLARTILASKAISIVREGELAGEIIDKDKLIDQHYYAIASKATLTTPDKLAVPEAKV